MGFVDLQGLVWGVNSEKSCFIKEVPWKYYNSGSTRRKSRRPKGICNSGWGEVTGLSRDLLGNIRIAWLLVAGVGPRHSSSGTTDNSV